MAIDWKLEKNNLAVANITGQLGKQEYDYLQSEIELAIKKIGHISILVILQDFSGWESADGWEDSSFYDRTDPYIKKLAIVGDSQWKDMVTVFTLKGLRSLPIKYFDTNDEASARQWLLTE